MELSKYVWVALGGGTGAVARYVVAGLGQRLTDGVFPLGTLVVNLAGCGAIGVAAGLFAGPAIVREEVRLAVMVGFLGGFTTFSTYGYETFALLAERAWWPALGNLAVSNLAGLLAVWLGYRVAAAWQGV